MIERNFLSWFFYLEFCESCKTFWLNVLANTTGCPKSINFPYSRKTMNDNEKCFLLLSAATIVVCHSLQFESTTINCCTLELGIDCTDVDELDQMCVTSHKLKKSKRNLLRGIVRCALPLPQTIVSCFVGLTKSKFLCYFKRIAIRLPSLRTSFLCESFSHYVLFFYWNCKFVNRSILQIGLDIIGLLF